MVKKDVLHVRCIWYGMEDIVLVVADYYGINPEL
jgi:hypothetical protein